MRSCVITLTCVLALLLLGLSILAKPGRDGPDRRGEEALLASLQGVWQEVSLEGAKGKVEEKDPKLFECLKAVKVVIGKKVYTAKSYLHGVGVSAHEIKVVAIGMPLAADFINPDNNATICALFEPKGDSLRICNSARRNTLKRPEKIAATPESEVHEFKRLPAPIRSAPRPDDKNSKTLTGVWRTVEAELDGEKYNDESEGDENKDKFWMERRFYYFQDGIYTMCIARDQDLIVTHKPYHILPKEGKPAIDFTNGDDSILPAIFEQVGDRLVICWTDIGAGRPDGFRTRKNDARILLRLERVDKAK